MKRCLCCALALLLLLLPASVRAEESGTEPARYTAITVKKTALSAEPRNGKNNGTIRFDAKVEVLEYGEKWCRVRYRSRTGYVRTRLLWGFVSMDPLHYPSPQFTACSGYVRLAGETLIKGGKFSGLSAAQARASSICGGSGRSGRQPCTVLSALIARSVSSSVSVPQSAGSCTQRTAVPSFSQARSIARS